MKDYKWFKCPRLDNSLIADADVEIFHKFGWSGRGIFWYVITFLNGREDTANIRIIASKGTPNSRSNAVVTTMKGLGILREATEKHPGTYRVALSNSLIFHETSEQRREEKRILEKIIPQRRERKKRAASKASPSQTAQSSESASPPPSSVLSSLGGDSLPEKIRELDECDDPNMDSIDIDSILGETENKLIEFSEQNSNPIPLTDVSWIKEWVELWNDKFGYNLPIEVNTSRKRLKERLESGESKESLIAKLAMFKTLYERYPKVKRHDISGLIKFKYFDLSWDALCNNYKKDIGQCSPLYVTESTYKKKPDDPNNIEHVDLKNVIDPSTLPLTPEELERRRK